MYSLLILKESGDIMNYKDESFLMDLKDYLVNDINKICIFINNEIE